MEKGINKMKVEISEGDKAYEIELQAENCKEASLLVRMGMNAKSERLYCDAYACPDGTFYLCAGIGKRKRTATLIPKAYSIKVLKKGN